MASKSDSRAIVPLRHRHDGWTPERQDRFLERLRGTGCVTEACRAVGLTTTSAYRTFHRLPGFARGWEQALEARRPMLEDAAFARAVHGSLQPLTRLGKVIGQRRHYSDSLLRFLIEREDRRAKVVTAEARELQPGDKGFKLPTPEETDKLMLERLELLARKRRKLKREAEVAFADRMRLEGKAP